MPPITAHSRIDIDSDSTTPLAERLGYNQEPQAFPSLSERLQPSINQTSKPAPLGERILKMRDGYTTGYQNPLEYNRPEPVKGSADLVAQAIAQVESGNKQVKGASGEFGAYQFMPATWETISKSMEGKVLPQTPENERRVATKKIDQLFKRFKAQGMDDATAARNVALIWNTSLGGSEVPLIKKGVNAKGVKYDSEAYARKVTETFNELLQSQPQGNEFSYNKQLKDKPSEALAMGIKNTVLPTPESPEQAKDWGLIAMKGPISGKDIYIDPMGVVGSMKRVGKNIAKKGVDAAKNIVNDIKGVSAQRAGTSVPFEAGKPIKAYHGTADTNLKTLDAEGRLAWFTNDKSMAQGIGGSNLIEKQLDFKNPYIFDAKGKVADGTIKQLIKDKDLRGVFSKYDGIVIKNPTKEAGIEYYVPLRNSTVKDASPSIPKELEALAAEARKYKSAEEFVRAQPAVYHGSPVPLKKFSNKKGGVFFTEEYADATGFAGSPDNVYEGYLNFKKPLVIDAKGAKWDDLNTKYGKTTQEVIGNAQKEGYDGVIFRNIIDNVADDAEAGLPGTIYYAYKPEDAFLNESQLIDFYNKTTGN